MHLTQCTARTLLTTALVTLTAAAHADATLMRREVITDAKVAAGGDKLIATVSVKGNKSRFEDQDIVTENGKDKVRGGEIVITDGDAGQTYSLNPFRHTYFSFPTNNEGVKGAAQPVVTFAPLPDTKNYLGHLCHGYHIEETNNLYFYIAASADVYVATDLPPVDVCGHYFGPLSEAADVFKQIGGMPLHMDMVQTGRDGRKVTFTVDVISFSTKPVRDKVFSIPKGYTLVPISPPPAAYHPSTEQKAQPK